jgi:hypothetical protein
VTGDASYLRSTLWQLMLFLRGPNSVGWMDDSTMLDTKRLTRVYRGLAHYLSALARAGMLERVERKLIEIDDEDDEGEENG